MDARTINRGLFDILQWEGAGATPTPDMIRQMAERAHYVSQRSQGNVGPCGLFRVYAGGTCERFAPLS